MKQGVTDPIVLTVTPGRIADAEAFIATVIQPERPPLIFKSADGDMTVDMDEGTITIPVTEKQSWNFRPGYAYVELRWINSDGTTEATEAGRIKIRGSINREMMTG